MSLTLKVPTHLDGRNPIVGRYTAREVVPLVAGVFAAAGVMAQPHLAPAVRVDEAVLVALLGTIIGLVRPGSRSLLAWGRLALQHLLAERRAVWTSPTAARSMATEPGTRRLPHLAGLPGSARVPQAQAAAAPPPEALTRMARRAATPRLPFVPVEIADDCLVYADGRQCAVLECSGTAVAFLEEDQQRTLHSAYHAFLLGLAFPLQVLLCTDPADLGAYTAQRLRRLAERPLEVRRLGSADAAYMRRALTRLGALDRRVYVVIPAEPPSADPPPGGWGLHALWRNHRPFADRDGQQTREARQLLVERCAAVQDGLARAGCRPAAWTAAPCACCVTGACAPARRACSRSMPDTPLCCPVPPSCSTSRPQRHQARRPIMRSPWRAWTAPPPDRHALTPVGAVAAALAPDAIEESATHLRFDGEWTRTLALSAWPGSVAWGWLSTLAALPERLVLALRLIPQDVAHSIAELTDLLVGLESVGLFAQGRGRLPSEERRQAQAEIREVLARLESHEERLFQVALYAQVHGDDRADLEARTRRVEAAFGAHRLQTRRALFAQQAGLESTLPTAQDRLGHRRPLPGTVAAASYPFGSPVLCMDDGVWYGRNTQNNTPLIIDPYAGPNSNSVVIGSSGAGKSAWTKVHLLRLGELDAQRVVVDPGQAGEYRALCAAVGGQVVRLSAGSHDRLNPLDLPRGGADEDDYDVLSEHVAGVIDLLEVLIAGEGVGLGTGPRARLEAALFRTYRTAGITRDPATHARSAPLLAHLRAALEGMGDDFGLAERLGRYCDGALSGLFSGATTVALDRDLTVFELHGVERNGDLRAALMHLVTQHVWRAVRSERRRRSVLIDEAHFVTRYAGIGDFLARLARQGRKHWCETIAASQAPLDFTATAAGRALILNSCRTWLLRCEEAALPGLSQAATLSERERAHLLRAPAGQGLLLAQHPRATGERLRLPFEILVSPEFAPLVFTDPAAGWGQDRRRERQGRDAPPAEDAHVR